MPQGMSGRYIFLSFDYQEIHRKYAPGSGIVGMCVDWARGCRV